MYPSEDPYLEYLKSRRGQRIYLQPYCGNAGDELIVLSTSLLVDRLGLIRVSDPQSADIILVPGGNATMWHMNLTPWQECWTRWPDAEFVVGPSGFQGTALPWREMLKNTTAKIGGLFARDPFSYENLCSLKLSPTIKIGLAHDPALHLRDSPWLAALRSKCSANYVLASFRWDHESTTRPPEANRQSKLWPLLSPFHRLHKRYRKKGHYRQRFDRVRQLAGSNLPLLKQDASMLDFQSYVDCISRASQVHTDRLHCMILAVLLDKPVFAYPTAYSKLEDIYEYSIHPWASVTIVRDKTVKTTPEKPSELIFAR